MEVAPKVLVSMMSAPAARYWRVDVADHVGPRQHQQVVVALQVLAVVREAFAAEVGLAEPVALDHRAHGAVDDGDALVQQGGQGLAAGVGQLVHGTIIAGQGAGIIAANDGEESCVPARSPKAGNAAGSSPSAVPRTRKTRRPSCAASCSLCGGDDADIVVIPTASQLRATGPRYERIFGELGAARVTALDFDTRRDCEEPGRLKRLQQASGIFFTGGNQLRLATLLGGTPSRRRSGQRTPRACTVGGHQRRREPSSANT